MPYVIDNAQTQKVIYTLTDTGLQLQDKICLQQRVNWHTALLLLIYTVDVELFLSKYIFGKISKKVSAVKRLV